MKITILDDYFDTIRTLPCFRMLDGHAVAFGQGDMPGQQIARLGPAHDAERAGAFADEA